jgi:hypothetical protein
MRRLVTLLSSGNIELRFRVFKLFELAECYATLRVFIENIWKKIAKKKLNKKKFHKKKFTNFPWFFFHIFFGYHGSTSNLEHACKNLGGLDPLVWEEIENEQTVHKGLAKLLYR